MKCECFVKLEVHLATLACLEARHSNIFKHLTQIRPNSIKNPNWQKVTNWLFSSVGWDLILEPSGWSRTQTLDCQFVDLAC